MNDLVRESASERVVASVVLIFMEMPLLTIGVGNGDGDRYNYCVHSTYLPVALEIGIFVTFVFWSATVRVLGSFSVVVVPLAPKARFCAGECTKG